LPEDAPAGPKPSPEAVAAALGCATAQDCARLCRDGTFLRAVDDPRANQPPLRPGECPSLGVAAVARVPRHGVWFAAYASGCLCCADGRSPGGRPEFRVAALRTGPAGEVAVVADVPLTEPLGRVYLIDATIDAADLDGDGRVELQVAFRFAEPQPICAVETCEYLCSGAANVREAAAIVDVVPYFGLAWAWLLSDRPPPGTEPGFTGRMSWQDPDGDGRSDIVVETSFEGSECAGEECEVVPARFERQVFRYDPSVDTWVPGPVETETGRQPQAPPPGY
jgi:hypothetical protein